MENYCNSSAKIADAKCITLSRKILMKEIWRSHNNQAEFFGSEAFKFLPYQLLVLCIELPWITGEKQLGFNSGEAT